MNFVYCLGLFVIIAYVFQIILGMKQMRHFNEVYSRLRSQGKVAIGKRPGRIRAGTIVMFALDREGVIIDSVKMQGVTIAARFKTMKQFNGLSLLDLEKDHPVVKSENKLIRQTILNAQDIYTRVQNGTFKEGR